MLLLNGGFVRGIGFGEGTLRVTGQPGGLGARGAHRPDVLKGV
jgi:hypothetical protein